MYNDSDITNITSKFLLEVAPDYPIKEAYLFGSYAKGNAREESDIDIAIVSDKFEGNRFMDRLKLGKYILKVSYDIQVHPFSVEDFTEDDPFVKEIKETGIRLKVN